MANDFKITLSANIDTTQIQKQLEQISKSFTFNLNAPSSSGGSGSLAKSMTDIQRIGAENLKWQNNRIALITKAEEENKKFNEKQLQDIQRIGAENLKWEQRRQAEFAKYQKQVDAFLAKSSNMNSANPKVANAIGVANSLGSAIANQDIDATRKLGAEFNTAKSALIGLREAGQSWTEGMLSSIKTTIQYAASIGLVYSALAQLKDGVQYVISLNKELTNIQLVTGQSTESLNSLGKQYNEMASDLGSTTLEIAKTSVEFTRQGRNAEESAILIKNSTMLQKLGNMEAAESTEKLTSIMNGFKMEAKETSLAIDKLISLDNQFASSTSEISTAMQYSANSAAQAGVNYDHLAAYITVISSTTRQSAEMIGTSLRTMFSRLTDISSGKVLDSAGEDISRVENSLKRVGIELRDSNHEFRNMQDVIGEVGKKWESLSETDQAFVGEQIAGKRVPELIVI